MVIIIISSSSVISIILLVVLSLLLLLLVVVVVDVVLMCNIKCVYIYTYIYIYTYHIMPITIGHARPISIPVSYTSSLILCPQQAPEESEILTRTGVLLRR